MKRLETGRMKPGNVPNYPFRSALPGMVELLLNGIPDIASAIPDTILTEPAVQLRGPGAPLVVSDPDMVGEVLVDRDDRFDRDPFMRRMMRRAWGDGIAAAEGESWKRQRRAIMPAFSQEAIGAARARIVAAAQAEARGWVPGQKLDLAAALPCVIARIVFSVFVDAGPEFDSAGVARDLPAYLDRIARFSALDLLPLPERWHDRMRGIPGDPAARRLQALAERLAGEPPPANSRFDLRRLLAGKGPLPDNVKGLFPAAMDTSVGAASWTLFLLTRFPKWQRRVAHESERFEDTGELADLAVTISCVKEAMRLFPPAPFLARTARSATKLGGYSLARRQPVTLAIYATHRHRGHWREPDEFDPSRWDEDGTSRAFFPFGAGPRMCPAARFAQAEIAMIVSAIAARVTLADVGHEPALHLQVSSRSANGLVIGIEPREPNAGGIRE